MPKIKTGPKVNAYTCLSCNFTIFTVDVDIGVTPFVITCRDRKCNSTMESNFYNVHPSYAPYAKYEWYKPLVAEGINKEHVERGGLLLRTRSNASIVNHEDCTS